jgi:Carboxypeptidase regulatory-like domain
MKGRFISIVRSLAVASTIALLSAAAGYAQQVSGTVQGIVTDESKAVIPGAEIVIKNVDTGASASTVANDDGAYRLPNLTPGNYIITINANGFKRAEYTQVVVQLGSTTSQDIILQVGGASEVVEVVSGGEVILKRDTAQIFTNYSAEKVAELPNSVAGGGVDTIALLTPGVVSPGDALFSNNNGTGISSNGGRGRSNNFTIDGQDNNDISVAGPAVGITNAEAVAEFQIVTNNFSAEYGQAGGAIINVVTKNGTNEFHGNVNYFYRNRKLFDTLTNLERRSGLAEAPNRLTNTFGFTVGGPIIKDKLLFFTSYQGIRQAESALIRSTSAGLTLTPNGIATALQFVQDPAIRDIIQRGAPFNQSIGSPIIRADIPTEIRMVNIAGRRVPLEFGAIQRVIQNPFEENLTTVRLDYNASDRLRMFGRYLYQKTENGNLDLGRAASGFPIDQPSRSQQIGYNLTYQVSSNAVNEFRFNYSRFRAIFGGGGTPSNPDDALTNITMPQNFLPFGIATNLPQGRINDNYQFLNNFSIVLGRHSLKMGLSFNRRLTESNFLPNQNGSFVFRTLDAFFNNTPNNVSIAIGPNSLNFTEFDQAYFFQDDLRVRDNLTLNIGVRYENTGQPINILNEITRKRESDPTTAIFNRNLPIENRIFPGIDTDNNNFAPRVGFAYSPRFLKRIFGEDKTVIRGGYGISYDLAFYNILLNSASAAPIVLAQTVAGRPGLLPVNAIGKNVRGLLSPLLPVGQLNPNLLSRTLVSNDFHNPYTQQYSFGIQRAFKSNTVLEASYVGTHSVGQFQSANANPRIAELARDFPQFLPAGVRPGANGRLIDGQGLTRLRFNGASSSYNSLQVRGDTRFKGLVLGGSYTFAKQLDNSSEIFGTFGGGNGIAFAQNPFDLNSSERGFGAFDFRHVFSVNFIYEIPVFREQRGLVGKLLGGYQVSGTYRANSGGRFTPLQGFFGSPFTDGAFNGGFNGGVETLRPFLGNAKAPVNNVAIDTQTAQDVFGINNVSPTGFFLLRSLADPNSPGPVAITLDQARFIANTPVTAKLFGTPFGNTPRNLLRGDDTSIGNFALFKETKITERMQLRFRVEMFNVFNHPNKGVPDVFIDDAIFADPNEVESGRRTIQFGMQLIF